MTSMEEGHKEALEKEVKEKSEALHALESLKQEVDNLKEAQD